MPGIRQKAGSGRSVKGKVMVDARHRFKDELQGPI